MCGIERISIKEKSLLWTTCTLVLCFVHGCGVGSRSAAVLAEGDRALAILSIEPVMDYADYDDPNQWWDDLISALNMEFWSLSCSDDHEDQLTRLIHQFGKHGPLADMKLCIADASVIFAQGSEHPGEPYLSTDRPEFKRVGAKYGEMQNLVSRIQVEFFLDNPDAFDRYYNALIWSQQFLLPHDGDWWSFVSKVSGLAQYFTSSPEEDPDYWWYAREFMLLALATGRDDLLRGVGPLGLHSRYEMWKDWLCSNISEKAGWTRLFPHPNKPIWIERDSILAQGRDLVNSPIMPFPEWNRDVQGAPPPLHLMYHLFSPSGELFGDGVPWPADHVLCDASGGNVSHVGEIPYIGAAISEFPASGEIGYASLDYCCRAEGCLGKYADVVFTGTASKEEVMEYCRRNGWSFTSAGAYTDYWSDVVRRHADSIDANDFPIASTSEDYELFKEAFAVNGDGLEGPAQLRINYNCKDERFMGHALCLIRTTPESQETERP